MQRRIAVIASGAALMSAAAATATPGAPDPTFGPGGMRLDTKVLRYMAVSEGASGLERIMPTTAGQLMVATRHRCGMGCTDVYIDRYLGGLRDMTYTRIAFNTSPADPVGGQFAPTTTGYILNRNGSSVVGFNSASNVWNLTTIAADGASRTAVPLAGAYRLLGRLSDGRVVAQHVVSPIASGDVVLLASDGSVDPSFAPVHPGAWVQPASVAIAGTTIWITWTVPGATTAHVIRRSTIDDTGVNTTVRLPQATGQTRAITGVQHIAAGSSQATLVLNARITTSTGSSSTTALLGIDSTGRVNSSFGSHGAVVVAGNDVVAARQRDGKTVVGAWVLGRPIEPSGRKHVIVVVRRLTARGALDATFPIRRIITPGLGVSGMDLKLTRLGKTMIGLGIERTNGSGALLMMRLRAK